MADTSTIIETPVSSVFAVLSDPRAYERFVVGNSRVRRFDPDWPDEGSEFHHSLGIRPFLIRDTSMSLGTDHRTFLVLLTRMGPLGATITSFVLSPHQGGTELAIREEPVWGPMALAWSKVVDSILDWRNRRLLVRLTDVAKEQFARERSVLTSGDETPAEETSG